MPHIDVNFDEVKEGFDLLPTGVYDLRVSSLEVKTGPKAQYMKIEFTVENGELVGRKVWDNISFLTGWKLKEIAKSAGLDVGAGGMDTEDLQDKIVKASVIEDSYKNESGTIVPKNSVKNYLSE